jgi:hypothetical protein
MRALRFLLLPILALAVGARFEGCPARCTCTPNGTVRCVFQKLTRVPKVATNTAVL